MEVAPQFGVHKAVKLIKGRTSRVLRQEFGWLRSRLPSLWTNSYFVSLCCTDVEMETLPTTGAMIGIDMGLKAFAITSDGMEYPNHKHLTKSQKKLAKLQRQLSRKSKGSNRREEARIPRLYPWGVSTGLPVDCCGPSVASSAWDFHRPA